MARAARGPSAAAAATGRVMLVGECSICLEEIRESERRSETPEGCSCRHVFHWPCLEQALLVNTACPNCRADYQCSGVLEIDPVASTRVLHWPAAVLLSSSGEESWDSGTEEEEEEEEEEQEEEEEEEIWSHGGLVVEQPNPLGIAAEQSTWHDRRPAPRRSATVSVTKATLGRVLLVLGIMLIPICLVALAALVLTSTEPSTPAEVEHEVARGWQPARVIAAIASNCTGRWSLCTRACGRAWQESTPQLGSGMACPSSPECTPGEDACPHLAVDCAGTWSACSLNCTREWSYRRRPAHGGARCPGEPQCRSGEDLCPRDVDCVVAWTVCTDACENAAERNGTVHQPAVRNGAPCAAILANPSDCSSGEGLCGAFPHRPGSVWAMGSNDFGELGEGSRTGRTTPLRIANLGGANVAVAAGGGDTSEHHRNRADLSVLPASGSVSLVVKADGRVFVFGMTAETPALSEPRGPVEVPHEIPGGGIRAVEAGAYHSVALTLDDGVLTWGNGLRGQLGHGSLDHEATPRLVVAHRIGSAVYGWRRSWIVGISAGGFHSAALTMEGRLYVWGAGTFSQLGNGYSRDYCHPVEITSVGEGNLQVALGRYHSLLLTATGAVLAWGRDVESQCGGGIHSTYGAVGQVIEPQPGTNQFCSGTICVVMTPTSPIFPADVNITAGQIAVARDSSYLLTAAGQLWAWGANYQGQLGDGTRTERSVPQHVGFYPEDSRQRLPHGGSSSNHMMVVQHDGSIMGSGQTGEGQLGPDPLVSWRDSAGVTHRPSSSMLHAMALPALGADNAAVARGWVHTLLVKEQ